MYTKQETEDCKKQLLELVKPGDTLYTILRHVSRSGMMRYISVITFQNGEPLHLDYCVAVVTGSGLAPGYDPGVKRTGCGMDMGFDIVYSLSYRLFGDGYALKQRWL